ncbi:23S rRNA (guanosine(2251)-2'-O)-methyltransferase RlmB, partial [Francisella tularensis subsp. holarctica]|uniref:RNA methyltransferase substrate-binding domain-containing protein n=1 Tax=Francisella tularensis TaxID=263 RepID=UPI002381AEF9
MSSLIYGIHAVDRLVEANQAKEILVFKKSNDNHKIEGIISKAESKGLKVSFIDSFKQLPGRVRKDANHHNIFA